LAQIMVTALKGERPSNVLIFGKTGTGKTAVVKYLGNEIKKADSELNRVTFLYMNCEVVDTQYGVLQNIGNQFILDFEDRIPFTGWSTERVYNRAGSSSLYWTRSTSWSTRVATMSSITSLRSTTTSRTPG
jgi:cell division control protein 6